MSGFGTAGLGTSALGFGDVSEADEPPEAAKLLSTWVSPATRDYEIDAVTGALAEVPPVRGRVIYCLTQIAGSSAVLPDDGIRYPTRIDESFESSYRSAVRKALRQLTDVEKVARIEKIEVKAVGSRVIGLVHYTDLTTGLIDAVRAS